MSFKENPKIGVIILAAGASSRMKGESKQLLTFQGKTLLRRAAETALQVEFYKTIVVLGANRENFRQEIEDLPLEIAVNEDWESGISSSIKKGLTTVSKENPDAVIFMLCDQPFVSAEVLRRLQDAFIKTKKPVIASKYENTLGVPALFARKIFGELKNLKDDEGAKKIISKDLNRTVLVAVPEAAFDVDIPRDYVELKQLSSPN